MNATWSQPFHGYQHYPERAEGQPAPRVWASVRDLGYAADCLIWTPGCRLNPATTRHATVEAARAYAEQQVRMLNGGELGVAA